MNDNRYRGALISYSKTLPPTLPDQDREKVLQAYLEELVEGDIAQVTAHGTLQLQHDSENVQHDILTFQRAQQGENELLAARSVLS